MLGIILGVFIEDLILLINLQDLGIISNKLVQIKYVA